VGAKDLRALRCAGRRAMRSGGKTERSFSFSHEIRARKTVVISEARMAELADAPDLGATSAGLAVASSATDTSLTGAAGLITARHPPHPYPL
jgi:hypothetical protein